jgi:predicted site-specific integrase-resolvase
VTKRKQKPPAAPVERLGLTIRQWCEATQQSRAATYRAMQAGELRYVQLSSRRRLIPNSEVKRRLANFAN